MASKPQALPDADAARKFRVAHIITRLSRGGAQENTFHTVRLADTQRFEVDLIAGPPLGAEGSLEAAIAREGIEIQREELLRRSPNPFNDLVALNRLARRLRDGRYDIVHTHTSKAGYLGRRAAKRAGTPIVVHTSHGNVFHGYFGPWPTRLFVAMERQAARWTDRLIELTPRGVDECLDHRIGRREQYCVIPSGIDIRQFAEARQARDETRAALGVGDEVLVGAVGRLDPVKGMDNLVRAAMRVTERTSRVRFVVAGRGAEAARLRALAKPMGDRFTFLGHREDVPAIMAALDVLVVPSINEGMGRVVLEAGAAGTPVIASRVGGMIDVVRDGHTGLLVPPANVEALANAMTNLIESESLRNRLGSGAARFVGPQFGLRQMVNSIETIYNELIEEKRLDS